MFFHHKSPFSFSVFSQGSFLISRVHYIFITLQLVCPGLGHFCPRQQNYIYFFLRRIKLNCSPDRCVLHADTNRWYNIRKSNSHFKIELITVHIEEHIQEGAMPFFVNWTLLKMSLKFKMKIILMVRGAFFALRNCTEN